MQYFGGFIHVNPIDEKRKKVELSKGNLFEALYYSPNIFFQVEHYFNDHFPLRDFFLRVNAQLDYTVFKRAREVIIGKDGWLCDKKVLVDQIYELDRLSDEEIKRAVIRLKKLQHFLDTQGIYFLMVIIPMKPTVYAEHYPEEYVKRPNKIMLERFQHALLINGISYIDALTILMDAKNAENVYFKTDMHFNSVGATIIAQSIITHLSHVFFQKDIWYTSMKKGMTQGFIGEESKTMPLLFNITEDAPTWSAEKNIYEPFNYAGNKRVEAYEGYSVSNHSETLLPSSIMFGNSFMLHYPQVGYHNYFTESYRVLDYQFFRNVLDYIEPTKCKIFILHIYETQLLFHLMDKLDSFHYWDHRIDQLPLPENYKYRSEHSFCVNNINDNIPPILK